MSKYLVVIEQTSAQGSYEDFVSGPWEKKEVAEAWGDAHCRRVDVRAYAVVKVVKRIKKVVPEIPAEEWVAE